MADIFEEAKDRFSEALEAVREDHLLAQEDFSFLAGEQWPETVERKREASNQPKLTINLLPHYMNQVVNDARQNKPAIKVFPVEDGDEDLAEIREGLIRNIEVQSQAGHHYVRSLSHAATGGFGFLRVGTKWASGFDQDLYVESVKDPFSVVIDPDANQYDRQDADFMFQSAMMTESAFEAKFPKANPASWDQEVRRWGQYASQWRDLDRVRVAEYFKKERRQYTLAMRPGQKPFELKVQMSAKDLQAAGIMTRPAEEVKIWRYLMNGSDEMLEDPVLWDCSLFPIVPVWGPSEWIGERERPLSLIRYAKDPQRLYNYWQSAIAEKIALTPKAPYIGTVKQFEGLQQLWANANIRNMAYIPYNPDPAAPGRPTREQPANINAAEIQQAAQAAQDIQRTTGIYDASLGAPSNETSGRAILARQREGDTATYGWVDNLSRSMETVGKIFLEMIPKVYSTERTVRIIGEDDGGKMVQLNGQGPDMTEGKYDLVVRVGPSYATRRAEAADSMMRFAQAVPQAAGIASDLIAKNMDWPGADDMAKRLKKTLPPGVEEVEDPEEREQMMAAQQRQQQIEDLDLQLTFQEKRLKLAKLQAEIQKIESETVENRVDAAVSASEAQRKGIETYAQLANSEPGRTQG